MNNLLHQLNSLKNNKLNIGINNQDIINFYCYVELLKIDYIKSNNYNIENCDKDILQNFDLLTNDLILNVDSSNKKIQYYNMFKALIIFILFSPLLFLLILFNKIIIKAGGGFYIDKSYNYNLFKYFIFD